jgi:mRNA-degrading endonuclease toxin of MazEF toxin-antitoxin module
VEESCSAGRIAVVRIVETPVCRWCTPARGASGTSIGRACESNGDTPPGPAALGLGPAVGRLESRRPHACRRGSCGLGELTRRNEARLKRAEVWWADLGAYRPRKQTRGRLAVICQSNMLTRTLQSVLVVPLTTNLDRASLAGTALIHSASAGGPPQDSVALAFQMRAISNRQRHARIVEQ